MENDRVPFFIRRLIQDTLVKRIEAFDKGFRQNVGLVGSLGTGKTQLLDHLYRLLADQYRMIPVYVHTPFIDFAQFVDSWAGAILTGIFSGQSIQPLDQISSLLNAADPIAPQTVARIRNLKKILRKEKPAIVLRELFSLTRLVAEETNKKVVLMLDEFQDLESLPCMDPFALLGKEIMVSKDTLFVVASSKPHQAFDIFHHKLSLLFGNFEVLALKSLGFTECFDYLDATLPHHILTPLQKKFVARMTDGHLFYLDTVCDRLKLLMPGGNDLSVSTHPFERMQTIADSMIIKVFSEELCDARGRLNLYFENQIHESRTNIKDASDYFKILIALAHGKHKLHAVAAYLNRKILETKKILHRLALEEKIERCGSFFFISDFLFSFWLKQVFEKRFEMHQPGRSHLQDHLNLGLNQELENLRVDQTAEIAPRIERLFKEFRNDIVEIDGKRFQCPQFTEVHLRLSEERLIHLFARNAKVKWQCFIAREKIMEEDIHFLLDELKRPRKIYQRKLLIALKGVDQNAKLLAQEAKIQIWNLRDLNLLMTLYDLPKIILSPDKDEYGENLGTLAESVHSA